MLQKAGKVFQWRKFCEGLSYVLGINKDIPTANSFIEEPKSILNYSIEHVMCQSVVSDSLRCHGLQPTRLLCPWNSSGKNTEVGSHSLLEGIFLTQGSNLALLHFRRILHCLSHQERPVEHRTRVIMRTPSNVVRLQQAKNYSSLSVDYIFQSLQQPIPNSQRRKLKLKNGTYCHLR